MYSERKEPFRGLPASPRESEFEQFGVKTVFTSYFWVEGEPDEIALTNRHNTTILECRDDPCTLSHRLNEWTANKDRVYGVGADIGRVKVCLKGLVLRTKSVPTHDDVKATELLLAGRCVTNLVSEQNETSACAEHGQTISDELLQRLANLEDPQELVNGA